MKKEKDPHTVVQGQVCPCCGYCPTCGRGGQKFIPYPSPWINPWFQPWYPANPIWISPWYSGTSVIVDSSSHPTTTILTTSHPPTSALGFSPETSSSSPPLGGIGCLGEGVFFGAEESSIDWYPEMKIPIERKE